MDRIADFCTRIRNAYMAKHVKVDIPHSKLRCGLADQLKNHGYIRGYRVAQVGKQGLIRIYLKYRKYRKKEQQPAITRIERVSKPSRRIYVNVDNIPEACSGYGIVILSTNKGIVDGKQAQDLKVGGEVLCQVW